MNSEEKIWFYLKSQGLTDAGAAGLMGNLFAESGLIPNNLQNSYEGKLGMADAEYTEMVDNGTYSNFAKDSAGYGLAQWTYWSRKQALLDYARSVGRSIGDLDMQLSFLMQELSSGYKAVLNILKTTASVKEASDAVLMQFERPADQSEATKTKRADYGQTYYNKYAGKKAIVAGDGAQKGATGMTEQQLRQKVVDIMNGWMGATKGSTLHLDIINIYNSHKPLARGYTMKVSDAYCAATVSAAFIKAGIADYTGTECGVGKFIDIAKEKGTWVENDAYIPKLGDVIVYDWDDNGVGDNTGSGDHIGIVSKVSGDSFVATEGNMSGGKVGTRPMKVNGRYIRGFIAPDYAAIASKMAGTTAAQASAGGGTASSSCASVDTVYTVVAGDTLSKIAAKYGTTYQVLAAYNGISNPNVIQASQKIKIPGTSTGIQKGSKVRVNSGAKTYTGGGLASYVYATVYEVIQISGDRAVIGQNGVTTAAMNIKDLTLA